MRAFIMILQAWDFEEKFLITQFQYNTASESLEA